MRTLFVITMVWSISHAETCDQILFYNSDTNINNYKQLKIEFDKFFEKIGHYKFQPFDDENIFETQLKENKFCMLILSNWYYIHLQKKMALMPILKAHRKGVDTQEIVLITKKMNDQKKIVLAKRTVASSISLLHSKALLNRILDDKHYDQNLNVLRVPKDIDALMAVGFGMSSYALSTFYSYHALSMINPSLYKRFICIGKKVKIPLMICAVLDLQKQSKLIDAFVNIDKIPHGKNSIKMLGIDGFKLYQRNVHHTPSRSSNGF